MSEASRASTRLPHILAALYTLAIAYASLQPFTPWIWPAPETPFFLRTWPVFWTRSDAALNVLAYAPFGFFVALLPQRMVPSHRALLALGVGGALSFSMETLQMAIPPRVAGTADLIANTAGAAIGGMLAATLAGDSKTRTRLREVRQRLFLSGRMGDVGVALLAVWLVAQLNPGIPLFALTFMAEPVRFAGNGPPLDGAALLIEAAGSAFQLLGVGIFLALLLRNRADAGGAVLVLVGAALLCKGVSAMLVLKPAVWQTWIRPGVMLGIAAGSLLMPLAINLPRPAQLAVSAILLLSSLVPPLLAPDLLQARAPSGWFDWRYGQLLNFNGLTRAALMVWPIFAATWLFALAGRPRWGEPEPLA